MKSIHYVATVVNTYRRLIDDITDEIEPDIPKYLLNIKKAENSFKANAQVLRTTYELSQTRLNAFDDRS